MNCTRLTSCINKAFIDDRNVDQDDQYNPYIATRISNDNNDHRAPTFEEYWTRLRNDNPDENRMGEQEDLLDDLPTMLQPTDDDDPIWRIQCRVYHSK